MRYFCIPCHQAPRTRSAAPGSSSRPRRRASSWRTCRGPSADPTAWAAARAPAVARFPPRCCRPAAGYNDSSFYMLGTLLHACLVPCSLPPTPPPPVPHCVICIVPLLHLCTPSSRLVRTRTQRLALTQFGLAKKPQKTCMFIGALPSVPSVPCRQLALQVIWSVTDLTAVSQNLNWYGSFDIVSNHGVLFLSAMPKNTGYGIPIPAV